MTPRRDRTVAEWVTLGVSSAALTVVALLIALEVGGSHGPPAPKAEIVDVREVDGSFHVDVEVTNEGGQTAANVQVVARFDGGGAQVGADQVIDFLARNEEADIAFVLDDDPSDGHLVVSVAGYTVP